MYLAKACFHCVFESNNFFTPNERHAPLKKSDRWHHRHRIMFATVKRRIFYSHIVGSHCLIRLPFIGNYRQWPVKDSHRDHKPFQVSPWYHHGQLLRMRPAIARRSSLRIPCVARSASAARYAWNHLRDDMLGRYGNLTWGHGWVGIVSWMPLGIVDVNMCLSFQRS